jgi:hypothetical protein
MKNLASSERRVNIWHLAVRLMFKNYNDLLATGLKVKCSDGNTRNIVMVLSQWLGDSPEIGSACCLVQVSTPHLNSLPLQPLSRSLPSSSLLREGARELES